MSDQNNANSGTPSQSNPAADNNAVISELKKANETLLSQMNNMKSEFNRKMTNIEQRVAPPRQQVVEEDEPLEDLVYSNPKKFTEKITQQATEAANRMVSSRQKDAEVIGNLIYEYPELQNKESELFKQAVKIYENMSPEEQNNPLARKLAVKEAAMELDVKPRHKRSQANDDFSMDGSSSYSNGNNRSTRSKENELSDATLEFAARVGMNISDSKVVERIKQRAQRKNWNRYE